jgi:hypothetical protein
MINIKYSALYLLFVSSFALANNPVNTVSFTCERTEKNYIERYDIKIVSESASQKAKVFMDGRDLDQLDSRTRQVVKSVVITEPSVFIATEAYFMPEEFGGIRYEAGTVMTMTTIDRQTGKLKKVETIQGGILSEKLGNGTRVYEEQCEPLKSNITDLKVQ